MDWCHPVHSIEYVIGEVIDEDASNVQARQHMAGNLVRYVEEISAQTKTALGRRKAAGRQCTKAEKYFLGRSGT